MKNTLLIDNYDSFTYNLFQYISEVSGVQPIVLRNDEMSWDEARGLDFDNIVISPGPGRPQQPADIGLSADATRNANVPILGVCLGHQAIAHLAGATVCLAPEPRHGRLSRVRHNGCSLFQSIPTPFSVVRYHSLTVEDLPQSLEAIAWAEDDGTLMALRHVERPVWGVQFHPESICSEHGRQLLANFLQLGKVEGFRGGGASRRLIRSTSGGRTEEHKYTVRARKLKSIVNSEMIFENLFLKHDSAFWLDSSANDSRTRFSYMGDASGPGADILTYNSRLRELIVESRGSRRTVRSSILDYIDDKLRSADFVEESALPFDFVGGFVGYFGYELKGELGGEYCHDANTPDASFLFIDRFVAIDHLEQEAWIVCLCDGEAPTASVEWLDDVEMKIDSIADADEKFHDPCSDTPNVLSYQILWRHDLKRYEEMVLQAMEMIRQGETYEVCLTNVLTSHLHPNVEPFEIYRNLRRINPAPYAAFLQFNKQLNILSASPELFLNLGADRVITSKPIKGTAARSSDPEQDRLNAELLHSNEKDRSENLMIVDLLRNDLNRVCEVGSVGVSALFAIETYQTVHQLVSTVVGKLPLDKTIIDCVRAAFPGGSMTGAPKIRTMKIIDALEGGARGVYSGSIGFISLNGTACLNIVIRTIVLNQERVSVGAGGAIIALSNPASEISEIILKAEAQKRALGAGSTASAPRPD